MSCIRTLLDKQSKRIIYYYQTFCGLDGLLDLPRKVATHIHVASVHFGYENDETVYIHLNDKYPDDQDFDKLWEDTEKAARMGTKIILMIGGAGGGYKTLFDQYEDCYELLKRMLKKYIFISGVNLDIEETVDINDVVKLVKDIKRDFPYFEISFAPCAYALQSDTPGMGGFVYKDLMKKLDGVISYFNVQFYDVFSVHDFCLCIENGYEQDMLVMGMMADPGDIKNNMMVLSSVMGSYNMIGGAYVWEYYNSYSPPKWCLEVEKVFSAVDYLYI